MNTETVKLLESDLPKTVQTGWLSKGTKFTLQIEGEFGAQEALNLMRILKTQWGLVFLEIHNIIDPHPLERWWDGKNNDP